MIVPLHLDLAGVELARHKRRRCRGCGRVRVLFSLVARGPGGVELGESDRLCAECSGIGPGDQPTSLDEVLAEAPTFREADVVVEDGLVPVVRIAVVVEPDDTEETIESKFREATAKLLAERADYHGGAPHPDVAPLVDDARRQLAERPKGTV